jgi:hypothetical protein
MERRYRPLVAGLCAVVAAGIAFALVDWLTVEETTKCEYDLANEQAKIT